MKLISTSKKPILRHSPDHWFGFPGIITFAFKNGVLLYGKNNKLYENNKAVGKYDIKDSQLSHKKMMEIYSEYTGKKEDKHEWVRGRTDQDKTGFNLWGNIDVNTIRKILNLLIKYNVLKPQKKYIIGLTYRGGSKIYEFDESDLSPDIQIKPHAAIRQHIYRKLGLESKLKKTIKWLIEKILK